MALERIVLNIIPAGEMPVFHCSQYENGRPVIIDLVSSDDDAFVVPEGASVELHCRKVDDNIVTLEPDEVDNNTVTFVSTEQLTACPGDNLCEIVLYADTDPVQTIATLNFILHVEPDPLEGGLTSETQIYNLTEQIEEITQQVIGDDYYDKTEVDGLLAGKADQATTYTKSEVDTALNLKADKATTYTKSQVDSALALKADASNVYTKSQTNTLLNAKANTSDLATVATTGDYDDLLNKPTIPAAQVQSDYEQADSSAVDYIKNKPDLSVYATNDDLADAIFGLLPTDSASGAIANFTTEIGADLVDCKAYIVASQASGTPTPSTPLPITGYSSANITRCGVNLLNPDTLEKRKVTSSNIMRLSFAPMWLDRGSYTLSFSGSQSIYLCDINNNYANTEIAPNMSPYTFTLTERKLIMFRFSVDTVGELVDTNIQLEIGNYSEYHAYNGQTYTIAFGQTVYGGVLDVTRGKLTVTHANIASYNGENINEPWLSSMDVYTEGGTPTTGAQVVYPLTTPVEVDLTPVQIRALVGVNNVFNDTNGNTEVKFKDSIQHYIDQRT